MISQTIQDFGGLDLRDDPPEVAGAVDMLNVDLDSRGRVRTRNGYTRFSTTAPHTYLKLLPAFPPPVTFPFLLLYLQAGTYKLDKVDSAGVVSTLGSLSSATVTATAKLGTPALSFMFVAQGGQTLRQVDAIFAVGTSTGKPYYVAVTPWDNRLVQGRYAGATDDPNAAGNASDSRIYFSDPGDPHTYANNNYIDLTPGDGESLTGMAAWRDSLIVFKRTRAFVFYGTSTDATGNPIFGYRTVSIPQRVRPTSDASQACVGGSDGVYFVAGDGIYRTDGSAPVCVSRTIEPLFTGSGSPPLTLSTVQGLDWVGERLYVRFTATNASAYTLVYDNLTGSWLLWQDGAVGYGEWPGASGSNRPDVYALRSSFVVKQDPAATTDDGTAIPSYYQAGWADYGTPADKRVREVALWGSGAPTLSLFTDRGSTDASAAVVTLATAPTVTRVAQSKSRTGRQFSWRVAATSGAFNISSVELLIADQRIL